MSKRAPGESALLRKIRSLPPEKVAEVEDFVEFLSRREDRQLTQFGEFTVADWKKSMLRSRLLSASA